VGPFEAQVIESVIAAVGVLTGLVLTLRFVLKKKELDLKRGGGDLLGPEIDALREELHETKAQVVELQERVDFAERLLSQGHRGKSE